MLSVCCVAAQLGHNSHECLSSELLSTRRLVDHVYVMYVYCVCI